MRENQIKNPIWCCITPVRSLINYLTPGTNNLYDVIKQSAFSKIWVILKSPVLRRLFCLDHPWNLYRKVNQRQCAVPDLWPAPNSRSILYANFTLLVALLYCWRYSEHLSVSRGSTTYLSMSLLTELMAICAIIKRPSSWQKLLNSRSVALKSCYK